MARILRAPSVTSPKTPRGASLAGTALRAAASFSDEARRVVKNKYSVRRLMVSDPNNPNTRPVFDQFTNNANPRYDPSKAPTSVQIKDGTPLPPRGATSGHQKVIGYNNQMRLGGKTLKRR